MKRWAFVPPGWRRRGLVFRIAIPTRSSCNLTHWLIESVELHAGLRAVACLRFIEAYGLWRNRAGVAITAVIRKLASGQKEIGV